MSSRRSRGRKSNTKESKQAAPPSKTLTLTIPPRPPTAAGSVEEASQPEELDEPTTPPCESPPGSFINPATPSEAATTQKKPVKTVASASCSLDAVFQDISDDSDAQKDAAPPPKRVRKKKESVAVDEELDEKLNRIVLLIPQSSGGGNKRKTIPSSASYEDVLSEVYTVIGCADVPRKPDLSYKHSDMTARSLPINLEGSDDWDGLCEDVVERQKKKKATVTVSIEVSEQYLLSLRSRAKEGKASQHSTASKKKKAKVTLMDLDNEDDDDNEGGDELIEKEKEYLEQLGKILSKCQRCGPNAFCRISRNGDHVNLTFQQRRGWAIALAHGTHGVTLNSPPTSEMFQKFHGSGVAKKAVAGPEPSTPVAPPMFMPSQMTPGAMNPFFMSPWSMLPHPAMFASPGISAAEASPRHHVKTPAKHELPSSDPPDKEGTEPYPEIEAFLMQLNKSQPRRSLMQYISEFDSHDYYNIDELANLQVGTLTGQSFNMSLGNAQYLIKEATKEVERIDRLRAKERKRARLS
ncbi:hypothetical protein NLJ89_g8134 [Agrocybe chaxingu]|uniref:Uncharacterized protein n=1 Tax=Agrocybe chaxingu TaxID=84603 RepID=A0A9W8K308_9AGAR|nr:hypothetical protein NLJ89_g8134 [Agrocybe chaxingu]